MKQFLSVVAAFVGALSLSVSAQWPSVKTPNVPRNADGSVNMDAPAPRTPDGKPDLSGVWASGFGGGGRGRGGAAAGGGAAAPGAAAPAAGGGAAAAPAGGGAAAGAGAAAGGRAAGGGGAPGGRGGGRGRGASTPEECAAAASAADPKAIPAASFGDVGSGWPGGANCLPLQQWAMELKKKRMSENSKDNPDAHCLPIGHMQLHLHPQPAKFLWTPYNEIVMIWESNYGLRHIYTDGRPAPANDSDNVPWWYGYTVGRWEGDELVATTTHLRDGMWLDVNGTPLTDQATIVERFRRPTYGRMEVDITIDDPKTFTRPITVRVGKRIMVDTDLIEFICNENEQSSKRYQ